MIRHPSPLVAGRDPTVRRGREYGQLCAEVNTEVVLEILARAEAASRTTL